MNPESDLYPCSFVIFGATGHLAATKLLPALYRLELQKRLPEVTNFIAFARREWADADWKAHMEQTLRAKLGKIFTPECFTRFAARFSYVRGDLQDAGSFKRLFEELAKPKTGVCSNIVFYLAIKPEDFSAVTGNLAAAGMAGGRSDSQVLGAGTRFHPHLPGGRLGPRGSQSSVRRRGSDLAGRSVTGVFMLNTRNRCARCVGSRACPMRDDL